MSTILATTKNTVLFWMKNSPQHHQNVRMWETFEAPGVVIVTSSCPGANLSLLSVPSKMKMEDLSCAHKPWFLSLWGFKKQNDQGFRVHMSQYVSSSSSSYIFVYMLTSSISHIKGSQDSFASRTTFIPPSRAARPASTACSGLHSTTLFINKQSAHR